MRDSVEVCVSTFVLGPWWVHLGTALVPKGAFASNTSPSVKTGQVGTGMWVLAETCAREEELLGGKSCDFWLPQGGQQCAWVAGANGQLRQHGPKVL